jgi:hypothetical protein
VATVAIALVVAAGAVAVMAVGGGGHSAPSARYGGIPSWLPKATVPVGRIVTADAAHPALAIQGDTVHVLVPPGGVMATAVGPQVPEEGRFPVPATSPCSFVVTFAAAHGTIPLRAAQFTILDELSRVHHPHVTAINGAAAPTDVTAGHPVSLEVSDVLPTGGGRLRWSPGGVTPVVSWDFDVEID